MPRDELEQGVGALVLFKGTVWARQKKEVKDAGGRVTKISDRHRWGWWSWWEKSSFHFLSYWLLALVKAYPTFWLVIGASKFGIWRNEKFHIFSFHLLFANLLVLWKYWWLRIFLLIFSFSNILILYNALLSNFFTMKNQSLDIQ